MNYPMSVRIIFLSLALLFFWFPQNSFSSNIKEELGKRLSVNYNKSILTKLVLIDLENYPSTFAEKAGISRPSFSKLRKPEKYGNLESTSRKVWRKFQDSNSELRSYLNSLPEENLKSFIIDSEELFKTSMVDFSCEVSWGKIRTSYTVDGTLNLSNLSITDTDLVSVVSSICSINIFPKILNLSSNFLTEVTELKPIYLNKYCRCIDLIKNQIDLLDFSNNLNKYSNISEDSLKEKILNKTILFPSSFYNEMKSKEPYSILCENPYQYLKN